MGANESIVVNHILKYQKNWNINFAYTFGLSMFAHKFLEKKNIFGALWKKANICTNI
jgi:hypothetical protein